MPNKKTEWVRNIRISVKDVYRDVVRLVKRLQDTKQCDRQPGIQVVVDLLLQAWEELDHVEQVRILSEFDTRICGYPFSSRKNPGTFAPKQFDDEPQDQWGLGAP